MKSPIGTAPVIVAARRTPFTRVGGRLRHLDALALGQVVVDDLIDELDLASVDQSRWQLLWGSALPYPDTWYGGRAIAIASGFPNVDGSAVEYACATSIRTAADGLRQLVLGEADVVIAGGSDSLSHHPLVSSAEIGNLARMPAEMRTGDSLAAYSVEDVLPRLMPIAEPYTSHTLAYHADEMMQQWGVSRTDADAFVVQGHHRAAASRQSLAKRMVAPEDNELVDDYVRADTSAEVLATLRTVNPEMGGVTVGNASRFTDGGAAVVLATNEAAKRHGWRPQGVIRSFALGAHDPTVGVLMGPAMTMPRALEQAGITWSDIDVIDLHEAFSGQVLANLAALGSREFMENMGLGGQWSTEIGPDRINQWGGSVALGHPFGATGSRLIMQVLDQLEANGSQFGVLGVCAGGSRGAAMVIERVTS
jgi:acetyl-CoA acyltransferase